VIVTAAQVLQSSSLLRGLTCVCVCVCVCVRIVTGIRNKKQHHEDTEDSQQPDPEHHQRWLLQVIKGIMIFCLFFGRKTA